jgi:hypothetical protein
MRCFIAAMVFLAAVPAGAATVSFELDFEYTGGDDPAGPPPWLVADFVDTGLNEVKMSINTFGLVDEEFVSSWFFNLDPELNAEFLSFRFVRESSTGLPATVSRGNDSQNAAGDRGQGFDIELTWSTSQGRQFIAGKEVVYMISYSDAENSGDMITAFSFNFFNQGGLLSAAHVQGISPGDGGGWIAAVPIPGTVWLFASGMLGLAVLRKRFKD